MEELYMNGQEVNLKSPGTTGLKDFLILQKALSKMPQIDKTGKTKEQIIEELQKSNVNFMDYISDKEIDSLTRLIDLSIKKTFPTMTEEIDDWAMKNSIAIMSNVMELCSPDEKPETDDQNRVEKLKEKILKDNAECTKA